MKIVQRKKSSNLPAISTASLPDIVFILLFFFMTVTVMQDKNMLVENELPNANESEEIISKDGIIEIYLGSPIGAYSDGLGNGPRIQLNGRFAKIDEVADYVLSEVSKMPEALSKAAIVSLKVDKNVSMGLVSDVKKELRSINMLKINYATMEGQVLDGF